MNEVSFHCFLRWTIFCVLSSQTVIYLPASGFIGEYHRWWERRRCGRFELSCRCDAIKKAVTARNRLLFAILVVNSCYWLGEWSVERDVEKKENLVWKLFTTFLFLHSTLTQAHFCCPLSFLNFFVWFHDTWLIWSFVLRMCRLIAYSRCSPFSANYCANGLICIAGICFIFFRKGSTQSWLTKKRMMLLKSCDAIENWRYCRWSSTFVHLLSFLLSLSTSSLSCS